MIKTLILDNKIDINNVAELKVELERYLDEPQIVIDASQIEKIDSMGAQLLISFMKKMKELTNEIIIENPSIVFRESIVTLGLKDEFNLMDDNNG